jgi:hypothetical protein
VPRAIGTIRDIGAACVIRSGQLVTPVVGTDKLNGAWNQVAIVEQSHQLATGEHPTAWTRAA